MITHRATRRRIAALLFAASFPVVLHGVVHAEAQSTGTGGELPGLVVESAPGEKVSPELCLHCQTGTAFAVVLGDQSASYLRPGEMASAESGTALPTPRETPGAPPRGPPVG